MSRRIYLIIYICCCVLTTLAQTTDEQYRKIYDAAERDYNIGRIMEAENLLNDTRRPTTFYRHGGQPKEWHDGNHHHCIQSGGEPE